MKLLQSFKILQNLAADLGPVLALLSSITLGALDAAACVVVDSCVFQKNKNVPTSTNTESTAKFVAV